jgi:hypothetical protein
MVTSDQRSLCQEIRWGIIDVIVDVIQKCGQKVNHPSNPLYAAAPLAITGDITNSGLDDLYTVMRPAAAVPK